ncbi:helix-hairpin-helix domain-containing protein [Streptomyces zhihengii]|uniref:helix-hairpin-helix domain-containing protein n=1 Tax=Streptomyces zhihengii TaxID=1818004 RepID=UPI003452189D
MTARTPGPHSGPSPDSPPEDPATGEAAGGGGTGGAAGGGLEGEATEAGPGADASADAAQAGGPEGDVAEAAGQAGGVDAAAAAGDEAGTGTTPADGGERPGVEAGSASEAGPEPDASADVTQAGDASQTAGQAGGADAAAAAGDEAGTDTTPADGGEQPEAGSASETGGPEPDASADATQAGDASQAAGQAGGADAAAAAEDEAGTDTTPADGGEQPEAGSASEAEPEPDASADATQAGGPEGGVAEAAGQAGGADAAAAAGDEAGTDTTPADGGEQPEAGEVGTETAAADGAQEGGVSEAEAELAAQRELRARIERRKAERGGPVASGAGLSGTAADLLAAVRAVEGGAPATAYFDGAPAVPRRPDPVPAPAPVRAVAAPAPDREAAAETVDAVRAVLERGGAPGALAGQVVEVLGEAAGERLAEDPWQLLAVPGVRPEQADGFARALLGPACGPDDERRAAALVGWVLERAALRGHTAQDASAVRAALAERQVPDPDKAVQQAVESGVALVFQEGLEEAAEGGDDGEGAGEDAGPVTVLLGLDRYAMAEESLAEGLARLIRTCAPAEWEGTELVRAAGANGVVLHTGGEAARAEPAALVAGARARGVRALLAVHGADGIRRLGAGAGAVTVASLLDGSAGPGRDEDGAFALDLLVVLDAPQLDVETAAVLVESMPDGSRLVLGGDPGVLPSAGAGQVLGDLLAARVCPQVASRTPDPGPLGELVSGIGIGELNQVEAPGKEIVIVPVRDAGEAVHRAVQLVADSVPRAIGVPAGQTQVITVGHGGSAGTRALNAALKQRLNPGPGRFGGFDPGDRVAYAQGLGRTVTGTVVSAGADGLHLDCDGTATVVPRARVESAVRHGWALTAHQAAGARWPAVVVVLPGDAAQGLSRPWVYTAFGRGERHVSVVHGVDQALPRAVAEVPGEPRTTRLSGLLEGLLAGTE